MSRRKAALCLLSLLLLSGCARQEHLQEAFSTLSDPSVQESSAAQQPVAGSLHVAVSPGDTLNPYTLSTRMNQHLMPLIYDPLIKLDENWQPQNYLAESVALSGTGCTVRLRSGVRFHDGRLLQAADVLYSLQLCLQDSGESRYQNLLSAEALDAHTLRFTLSRPDAYFANLLCFPIIGEGSGEQVSPPGTGRYRISGENRLIRNDSHFDGGSPIREILLTPMEDIKEIGYEMITGRLDYALLEADAFPVETAGSFPVQTNSLLYLGCNTHIYPLSDPAFRQALALAIDRGELVQQGYSGRAIAAPDPVNPLFYPGEAPEPDLEKANMQLDALGFTARDEEGFRMAGSRPLELTLAINVESPGRRTASKLLQLQLEKLGLRLTVNEYPYDTYKSQLEVGAYSFYLGQTLLPEDMGLDAFLSQEGALHYQLGDTSELYAAYFQARQEAGSYGDFFTQFKEQQPFIPLLFPQASVARSRNFYSAVLATEQDIFYNIHKW